MTLQPRYATLTEAFLASLPHHPGWRVGDDGRIHRFGDGRRITVNRAAERFAELGWIRIHVDGEGGHYWTVTTEGER